MACPLFADFSIDLCMSKDIAHKKIAVLFQIHWDMPETQEAFYYPTLYNLLHLILKIYNTVQWCAYERHVGSMPQYFQKWKKIGQTLAMLQEKWSQYFLSFTNSSWSNGQNVLPLHWKVSWHISDTNNISFQALAIYGVPYLHLSYKIPINYPISLSVDHSIHPRFGSFGIDYGVFPKTTYYKIPMANSIYIKGATDLLKK